MNHRQIAEHLHSAAKGYGAGVDDIEKCLLSIPTHLFDEFFYTISRIAEKSGFEALSFDDLLAEQKEVTTYVLTHTEKYPAVKELRYYDKIATTDRALAIKFIAQHCTDHTIEEIEQALDGELDLEYKHSMRGSGCTIEHVKTLQHESQTH